jgi:hypothetical protein
MACPRGSPFQCFVAPPGKVVVGRINSIYSSDVLNILIELSLVFVSIFTLEVHRRRY